MEDKGMGVGSPNVSENIDQSIAFMAPVRPDFASLSTRSLASFSNQDHIGPFSKFRFLDTSRTSRFVSEERSVMVPFNLESESKILFVVVFQTASASVGMPQYPIPRKSGKQRNPALQVCLSGSQPFRSAPTTVSSRSTNATMSILAKIMTEIYYGTRTSSN